MFTMIYDQTEDAVMPCKTIAKINDEEVNLRQLFLGFVEMTRIMGFQSGSWNNIIEKAYKYCILHEEACRDFDIYEWAVCDINEEGSL